MVGQPAMEITLMIAENPSAPENRSNNEKLYYKFMTDSYYI